MLRDGKSACNWSLKARYFSLLNLRICRERGTTGRYSTAPESAAMCTSPCSCQYKNASETVFSSQNSRAATVSNALSGEESAQNKPVR